jgi:hypothetical protein
MAEFQDSVMFQFPKLNAENYTTWKVDMKVLLIDRGCWEFVVGESKPPTKDESERDRRNYELRKARAYTSIYQAVERKFQLLISNTTDGKIAWDTLKQNFEPTSRARLAGLIDEFYDLRFYPDSETIGLFIKKVNEKALQVKDAGFDIPEILKCFQFIRRLPPEYENLVQSLYRLDDKEFSALNIESQLVSEYGRIQQKKKDEGNGVADAYITKTRILKNTKQGTYSGRELGQFNSKERPVQQGNFLGPCWKCKKMGHKMTHCKSNVKERMHREHYKRLSKPEDLYYSEVGREPPPTGDGRSRTEWLIDSAATSHFCNQRDLFIDFRPLSATHAKIGDRNANLQVTGIGTVNLILIDSNRHVNLKLSNVLYAPDIRRNLIGGANIDIAKYKIIWANNKMVIYNENNEYFCTVRRKGKLYVVYAYPGKSSSKECNICNLDIELLHKRCCHINVLLLQEMCRNKIVNGLDKIGGKLVSCEICGIAKSTRNSFKSLKECQTREVLDLIHMDLWGPAPVKSLGGKKYFLSIIDDYSRKIDIYTIKDKTEVLACFKDYLVKSERELGIKLKAIRTDNGLEFANQAFENYLSDLGIKIQRTSVYTPEQMGVCERFNRTAMNGVRAMLLDSGLKPNFWGEALNTFVYIRNRCPHPLLKNKTAYEIWTSRKPSIKHFRIFGSLAYVHVPKLKRNKLEPRAKLGIFVGYASRTKGYRVYLPGERKVIESIHVKIDESRKSVETLFGKDRECSSETIKYSLNFQEENENGEQFNNSLFEKISDQKLSKLDTTDWKREEKLSKFGDRIYVYYFTPDNTRLRSQNDFKKYCESHGFEYVPNACNFKSESKCESLSETLGDENTENKNPEECNTLSDIFLDEVYSIECPKTYKDAENDVNRIKWKSAMADEISTMKTRNVWELVDPPPKAKIINCRWVYSIKRDENNEVKRYKARLVAQGFRQREYIDYTNVFSPVVNFSVIKFLFIILVCILKWKHYQLDVKSAYLYGPLNETILMKQPPGFVVSGQENKVCKLKKAIYGLKQSGRQWNDELDSILKSIGFENLKWCNCVYKMCNTVLVVYVDDLVIFSKELIEINKIIDNLKNKLDIKELGEVKYLLGVNFESNGSEIYLHQQTYISKLINRFSDLPNSHARVPLKIGMNIPEKVNENEIVENELMVKYPYRSLIGCLSFLADRTRPDISYAVNAMSQYCNGYTYEHWKIVVNILSYVFNTKDDKINLSNYNEYTLIGYSDADWGSKLFNRHSTSGYILFIGNTPFSWKSHKQKCIALSSMESEFLALTESVKELTWFSKIISELNVTKCLIPIQYCDNQSAIYFSNNCIENCKTKHIDIKLQFVRDYLNKNIFHLRYVNSKKNIADFLTKVVVKEKLLNCLKSIFCM